MNRFNRLLTAMGATAFILCGCEQNDSNPVDEAPVAARITSTIAAQNTTDNDRAPSTRASETSWANGDLIGVSASSTTGTTSYTNIKYAATGTAGNFAVVNAAGEDNDIYFQDQKSTDFSAYYPYAGTNGTLHRQPNRQQHQRRRRSQVQVRPQRQRKCQVQRRCRHLHGQQLRARVPYQ